MQANNSNNETDKQDIDRDIFPPYPAISPSDLKQILRRMYFEVNCKYYIRYKDQSRQGDAGLVVARISVLNVEKVVSQRFPYTEEGWFSAWRTLAIIDHGDFERLREGLYLDSRKYGDRTERQDSHQEPKKSSPVLLLLADLTFLNGYTPCASLMAGSTYDLIFTNDSLQVFDAGAQQRALAKLNYNTFIDVQATGPGLIKSTNPFVDPAGKIIGAAIRNTQPGISGDVLNGAVNVAVEVTKNRSKIKTILFAQTTDSELFFLYTKTTPDQLRIDLSPTLGRIRKTLASARINRQSEDGPDATSIVKQLMDASLLLDRGLITRDEFEQLKAQLLSSG
jgi:putative oligomerization/nucleic acid binding protein